ncbi:erythromycin biosynthesis sensory transduction protein eryC1 [Pseudomonas taiwanensis]|uniref:DegT/DnrJ/EryC1/StrS family aminotransferase n=1 Tax=Pseudomonas taiwanensis TaxID=470150 RepID=UPI0015BB8E09|nr:DegT/DnrJ/EryC1/StrS family aminotransferase [Pseudomonas taiwanensis]NWL78581.1 erythromycin biosynthesis sensory transduction protein eryC1 [Pseudomonas taiwanensis]
MLPINDLARHNGPLDAQLRSAIDRVLGRGYYILGPENQAFEKEFASYLGVVGAVGVGNGTDALTLALRALGIGLGDQVITVANAGMYASTAIRAVGAEPRFVDIEPVHLQMDVAQLEAAISSSTRAVILTHLYGRMADVETVRELTRRRGVALIEDCAQSHGARLQGRCAGSWGDLATFSFYPTKNLGALGDGGMVVGQDQALLERVARLRQYGWTSKYCVEESGGANSRLDEIQAAVLREKLPRLDAWNSRRREIVQRYRAGLAHLGWQLPAEPGEESVAHLFIVRMAKREAIRQVLKEQGIGTDVHYPIGDHQQPAYALAQALPVTERTSEQLLTLPCFPEMLDEEVDQVIKACELAMEQVA